MSEQATAKNDEAKPVPDHLMKRLMETAFAETDRAFGQHVVKNWQALGRPEIQSEIAEEGDIPGTEFSRWYLINNIGDTREALQEAMAGVHDGQSFGEGCLDFIDREMEHLFFVSNNMAEARVARDYFEQFLTTATQALLAAGKIDKDTAESYGALSDYYDVAFESYECLREMVDVSSGHVTNSLVAYAMAQNRTVENTDALVKLQRMTHTDAMASDMVAEMSHRCFTQMMQQQPIFHNETTEFDYMTPWITVRAQEIAQEQYTQHPPETFDKAGARERARQHLTTQLELVNGSFDNIREHGIVEGILESERMFDSVRKDLLGMPETFDELLDCALVEAAVKAKPTLQAVARTDMERLAVIAQPTSAALGKSLWPHVDDPRTIPGMAEEISEYWHEVLGRAGSPQHVAQKADTLVDEMARDAFFGTTSPALLLYAANYLSETRRALGSTMQMEGAFKPEDYTTLKRVEEKCLHYYESYYTFREWMMLDSQGTYDRLGLQEYMRYAADSGRAYDDMTVPEWNQMVIPAAQKTFTTILKNMNVQHKGCDHPMMPLIAAKARTIAGNEGGEVPEGADDDAQAAYYEKVWARAGEVLHGALDRLPERDIDSGHKIKRQPFTADQVGKLMKDLDRQIQLSGHRGTRH